MGNNSNNTHAVQDYDLCKLADVKAAIFRGGGNATTADDDLLQRMISAFSAWIKDRTHQYFYAGNETEVRSGTGGRILFVKRPPINSVASVYINGSAIPAKSSNVADYMTSLGYSFSDAYVSLFGYIFDRGLDNVTISYNGGYNAVPTDIEQMAIEMVAWKYKELDRIGELSKALAGGTVSFSQAALSEAMKELLEHYKRVVPVENAL